MSKLSTFAVGAVAGFAAAMGVAQVRGLNANPFGPDQHFAPGEPHGHLIAGPLTPEEKSKFNITFSEHSKSGRDERRQITYLLEGGYAPSAHDSQYVRKIVSLVYSDRRAHRLGRA